MSYGSIGAYGSNLSQTLSKLLARLDDLLAPAATEPDKTEAKAERQGCGDKKHPPRGEARLSSQILNVLLRLQQQEEASAAEAPGDTAADAGTATDGGEATATGNAATGDAAAETKKSPVHRLFAAIDANADNSIDKDELTAFITEKGGTAEEAERLFAILDKDSDGAVSEEQLAASIRRGHHGHHHGGVGLTELAAKLFAKIDGDSDGAVTKEEMTDFVTARGGSAEKVEAKFAKLDKNDDGSLDQDELTAALRGRLNGRHFGHFHRRDWPAAADAPAAATPTPESTASTSTPTETEATAAA
ncbi:MAG: EF-hand domain-containing protein [Rhodospirillales bacterium]|nr:EF-hand domain-containing protein [Rhodospirillales bacterium]